MYDVLPKAANIFFSPTDEAKGAALKEFSEQHFPGFLKIMNTRLAGKVYVTGKLSIADFAFGAFLSQTAFNPNSPFQKQFEGIVKNYPNVQAFWSNFA